jgi:CubicO group peptidase (beta-lactamase class C family)
MRALSFVLFSAVLSVCTAASPDVDHRVDELFRSVAGGKSPGAAVAAIKEGKVVLMKGYGMANVEAGVPISPTTIFRLGSVTKSFTAIAVLQLADSGKLKLNDPLSKYVPEFPHGDKIRISHLLSHTAGVPDFIPYDEVLKRPLEFEPGSRINYSNNGYLLLGRVIEKASGLSWDGYLRDHIFAPIGMKRTGYDKKAELPGRATGYLVGKDGTYSAVAAQDALGAHSAGGLYSTIEDLARFEQALTSGKLLRKETLEKASTPGLLTDGRRTRYGYGWMTANFKGLEEIGHGGDITGFNTFMARYPSEKFSVIVLSNTGMRPPGPLPTAVDLMHNVAAICLGDRIQNAEARPAIRVDAKTLDAYVGRYKFDIPEAMVQHMGSHLIVSRSEDGLVAEANGIKLPLEARSKTEFQSPGSPAELTFVRGTAEKCPKVIVTLMGLREFQAIRE